MTLAHVGLVCSSEANADRFYKDLLGLAKVGRKTLPRELSRAIFNINEDLMIIHYAGNGILFEIFVCNRPCEKPQPVEHACLHVEDIAGLVQKARAMGLKVTQVPKGQSVLSFVSDPDGNLFELN